MGMTISDLAQDFIFCELCDNYCPRDFCDACGESVCEYCHREYGCDYL